MCLESQKAAAGVGGGGGAEKARNQKCIHMHRSNLFLTK